MTPDTCFRPDNTYEIKLHDAGANRCLIPIEGEEFTNKVPTAVANIPAIESKAPRPPEGVLDLYSIVQFLDNKFPRQ